MRLYGLRSAVLRFADGAVVTLPDLEVTAGERIAILGPNGAGKTTLLRVLAFLARPNGHFEAGVAPGDVAFVAQRPYLFRGTVAVNVALALRGGVPRAERRRRVLAALDIVGAADLLTRRREALSAGEVQRVALARALVARPRVLLLDEPLGPLDADGATRLAATLVETPALTVVAAAPDPSGIPLPSDARLLRLTRSANGPAPRTDGAAAPALPRPAGSGSAR